ncbi:MAG: S8 family serine peptidase [Pyrinomonadaceae bacterium]
MYMLNAEKQRIQLARIETEVTTDLVSRAVVVRAATHHEADPFNASGLIARASRTFFEIGQIAGKTAAPQLPKGPPPVAFRESETGFLHVAYHEVVIRFAHGTAKTKQDAILGKHGFKVREANRFIPNQFIVHDPSRKQSGEQLLEVANDWAEMDEVAFAAPNFVSQFQRQAPPNLRAEEWHLRLPGNGPKNAEGVDILAAWKLTRGKRAIVVAVLDDGVDIEHPNMRSRIWKNPDASSPDKNGRDFFLADTDPGHFNPRPKLFRDPFHIMSGNDIHGTPCAGVIAAGGRSGGSVGAAPRCRVLPIKVFHADDLASTARVADAIRHAALHADILSCSWSGGGHPNIQAALADAINIGRQGKGVAIFCAAGNDSTASAKRPVGFPARDRNAIAVGACTDRARIASYSNVGPQLAFVAPSSGGTRGIFTTDVALSNRGFNVGVAADGGTDGLHTNDFGGTSSATPLAAGVAALMLSVNPDLTHADVRDILARTADKIGGGYDADGHSDVFGFGRINAGKAVQEARGLARAAKAAARAEAKTARPARRGVAKKRGIAAASGAKKAARKSGAKKAASKRGAKGR